MAAVGGAIPLLDDTEYEAADSSDGIRLLSDFSPLEWHGGGVKGQGRCLPLGDPIKSASSAFRKRTNLLVWTEAPLRTHTVGNFFCTGVLEVVHAVGASDVRNSLGANQGMSPCGNVRELGKLSLELLLRVVASPCLPHALVRCCRELPLVTVYALFCMWGGVTLIAVGCAVTGSERGWLLLYCTECHDCDVSSRVVTQRCTTRHRPSRPPLMPRPTWQR